ncbi:hypothetical protein [Microbacterium maritypicum]|uniref:hypothetical protein n=1 Tax=Microbacterium maritypicum TaxID=33918 RepID=UPI0038051940
MKQTAELLWNQGDDWFAVCYFYAAYHMARAAIMTDPIFDDLTKLQAKASWLTLEDRYVTAHQGRVVSGQPRKAGVNDVVRLLYPGIAAQYIRLHMASVEVRYQEGLRAIHRDSAEQDFLAVQAAYLERRLIAA